MHLSHLTDKLFTLAIAICPFLSEGAKVTLLYLYSLDKHEVAVCVMARARGKNDSTIQLYIKELKKQKYISVVAKSGKKKSTSVYSCDPDTLFKSMGISARDRATIEKAFDKLNDPDFLFDLTKKLHDKNIDLPNSNEHLRFFNKSIKQYNRGDVVKYYCCAYKNKMGSAHRVTNKRDHILCSQLLKRHKPVALCKIIDHTFSKRGDLVSLSFDVFCRTLKTGQDFPTFKHKKTKS